MDIRSSEDIALPTTLMIVQFNNILYKLHRWSIFLLFSPRQGLQSFQCWPGMISCWKKTAAFVHFICDLFLAWDVRFSKAVCVVFFVVSSYTERSLFSEYLDVLLQRKMTPFPLQDRVRFCQFILSLCWEDMQY